MLEMKEFVRSEDLILVFVSGKALFTRIFQCYPVIK
jgi:hypothetical protein